MFARGCKGSANDSVHLLLFRTSGLNCFLSVGSLVARSIDSLFFFQV